MLGNERSDADVAGMCVAPALALLPLRFPRVAEWLRRPVQLALDACHNVIMSYRCMEPDADKAAKFLPWLVDQPPWPARDVESFQAQLATAEATQPKPVLPEALREKNLAKCLGNAKQCKAMQSNAKQL